MKRTTNGFDKLTLANFRKKVDLIVSSMTNNTYFMPLQSDVRTIAAELLAYKIMDDTADGGSQNILKRDRARVALIDKLHLLGNDVTAAAKNNVEILASSGFSYTQDRKTSPNLTKPAPPRLTAGVNKGEICCRTKRQAGMMGVNFYYTTDTTALAAADGTGWEINMTTKVKLTLEGLISGQLYYVKVGLIGVRGQEVFSDPVSYIPQ